MPRSFPLTARAYPRACTFRQRRWATLARARTMGFDPRAVLAGHDSYSLFAALDALIRTGPTLTNVNDIRAILITPRLPGGGPDDGRA